MSSKENDLVKSMEQQYLELLNVNGMSIVDIPPHLWSKNICLAAVKQNGLALQFMRHQDEDIVRTAVNQNQEAVRFVNVNCLQYLNFNQMVARNNLMNYGNKFSPPNLSISGPLSPIWAGGPWAPVFRTFDGQAAASFLGQGELPEDYIKHWTEKLKNDGMSLLLLPIQNNELCSIAVKQNGLALQYVRHQTEDIVKAAIDQNADAVQHIHPMFFYLITPERVNQVGSVSETTKTEDPTSNATDKPQQGPQPSQANQPQCGYRPFIFPNMPLFIPDTPFTHMQVPPSRKKTSSKKREKIKTVGDFFDAFEDQSKHENKVLIARIANFDFIVALFEYGEDPDVKPIEAARHIPIVYVGHIPGEMLDDVEHWVIKDEFTHEFLRLCTFNPDDNPFCVWLMQNPQ